MSDIIDGALVRIHHAGPELIVGGPDHGPMGAETLVTLGLDERDVMEWIDGYSPRLAPMPAQAAPVDPASPNEALGQPDRVHDWWTSFNCGTSNLSKFGLLGARRDAQARRPLFF